MRGGGYFSLCQISSSARWEKEEVSFGMYKCVVTGKDDNIVTMNKL